MVVFRVGRTKWAKDLSGTGAKLFGGRWNHIGLACLYTSENRSLAVLEYTVNTNIDDIPRHLSLTTLEIPDDILNNPIASLPGDWKEDPALSSTKDYGSSLLKSATHPILKFPSSVIPQEFNYIINPLHGSFSMVKILEVEDFIYDVRIKVK